MYKGDKVQFKVLVNDPLSKHGFRNFYTDSCKIKRTVLNHIGFSGKNASKYSSTHNVRYRGEVYPLYTDRHYGLCIKLN